MAESYLTSGGGAKAVMGVLLYVWWPVEAVSHDLSDIWRPREAVSEDLCPTFGAERRSRGLVALGLATAGVCHGHLALCLAAEREAVRNDYPDIWRPVEAVRNDHPDIWRPVEAVRNDHPDIWRP